MNSHVLFFVVIITLFIYSALFVAAWLEFVDINNKVFTQNQNQNSTINTNTASTCDFSFVAPDLSNGIKYAAVNNNNTCPLQSYYQAGPIPDPNDPTHVKAQQQSEI